MFIQIDDFWQMWVTLLATGLATLTGGIIGFLIAGLLWSLLCTCLQRNSERAQRRSEREAARTSISSEEFPTDGLSNNGFPSGDSLTYDSPSAVPMNETGTTTVLIDVRRGAALSALHTRR